MRVVRMVNIKVYTEDKVSISTIELDDSVKEVVGDNINRAVYIPLNLPMIVKPKAYDEKHQYGGYLLNNIEYYEPLISKKISQKLPTVIEDVRLYDNLNRMMHTPYKINKELLDYIINFNHIFNG